MYFLIAVMFIQKINCEKSVKNHIFSLISGLAVGIGFLTKIYPIVFIPIGFLWLLKKKRYSDIVIFILSFLSITGGILIYLFIIYPRFKYLAFGWQLDNRVPSGVCLMQLQ